VFVVVNCYIVIFIAMIVTAINYKILLKYSDLGPGLFFKLKIKAGI